MLTGNFSAVVLVYGDSLCFSVRRYIASFQQGPQFVMIEIFHQRGMFSC